ncbi:IS5/IS1182 family transposase, partial [Alkalihalophilus lindianensis]|nr:IS5/IS1182 family transposase [Alkalihalophilus lindianensis]
PVFENCHDELILQAFQEGFRDGSNIAIYATHVEARDAANLAKKRSRKRKNQPTATEQMDLLLEKPKEETPVSDPEKP